MRKALIYVSFSAMLLLTGCNSSNQLSQAQLNAIETREVDANMNEIYNAASGALFDAGYTIAMSDRQGGLLTGTKAIDRSADRFWISPYIEDTRFAVSVQIRETTPKSCTVRIKTSVNGAPKVDKKAIDQLWILMQRQVLMKEPLPLSNEKASISKEEPNVPLTISPKVIQCENCGHEIGKLEKTYVHEGHIVCSQCYSKLKQQQ